MRGEQARNLARDANLFVMRVDEHGAARLRYGVLEVGPNASPDAIATIACRKLLEMDGERDELQVQAFVESLGYEYIPLRCSEVMLRAVS